MGPVTAEAVASRLAVIRRRIDAASVGRAVRIVAVTKGHDVDAIDAALAVGLTDIGENYAQELLAKRASVEGRGATVHFIGRLQTNKVRHLADLVQVWQTIDRTHVADEVAKRAPGATVLVQVNVSGEPQKGGCEPGEVGELTRRCQGQGLHVSGLMAVGATGPADLARPGFALLRRLADELDLADCSMGMTDDLEVAVEEGATIVRIGSALFGPRQARPDLRN